MQTESLNILEPIKNRYSSRAFENQLISQSEVNSLLAAARWAPSAMNAQLKKAISFIIPLRGC